MVSEERRVTIYDERSDRGWFILDAYLRDGDLVLEGHDMGRTVEEFWGEDEYEYWYVVRSANVERVRTMLLDRTGRDSGDDLLGLVADGLVPFGEGASRAFRTWLEEADISYEFANWV